MLTARFVCIHGHFYQPPRENPWLEEVPFEDSARPYHDWNARVTAECYAPNSVSRIMDPDWRIIGLVNNYSKIDFNFGPTLLYWLARHHADVYDSILQADKESIKHFGGHGSAISQVYNHMIMPLANRRDKETQVRWGIKDFETRFKRMPEGMWLPETAVDVETLEVLASNGVKFTILSPHQASRVRRTGEKEWTDVSGGKIDPRRPYLCTLPSGRSISLFFFDKPVASESAFGNLLSSGEGFAKGLIGAFEGASDSSALVSLASDGELYGHHHPHGDMTLAYCLYYIESKNLARITNYAEYLEKYPPQYDVEIQENTSWSCAHGVERWRSDCGDNTGYRKDWRQAWRKPLREAMDWLRDTIAPLFEKEASGYFKDPWEARNRYVDVVLDRSGQSVERFLSEQAKRELTEDEKSRAIRLLEMQRQALLMYTSCGWFFDEVSGIETVQVMMYAARAMQLAKMIFGGDLEGEYLKRLKEAPSNLSMFENGAKIYELLVKPVVVDLAKIGAQRAIQSLFSEKVAPSADFVSYGCCFEITDQELERFENGKFRLVVSLSKVRSSITLDEQVVGCAAIWLGDHNVSCGVKSGMDEQAFKAMRDDVRKSFEKGEINETILLLPKHFGESNYSLKDMFEDDQIQILEFIFRDSVKKATELYEIIFKDNAAMLRFMNEIRVPVPSLFKVAADVTVNSQLLQMMREKNLDTEALNKLIADFQTLEVSFDPDVLGLEISERITQELAGLLTSEVDVDRLKKVKEMTSVLTRLPVKLNLWTAQNAAFEIAEKWYKPMKDRNDEQSRVWTSNFTSLCESLGIRLA